MFWLIGVTVHDCVPYFKILDDEDNTVEECTKEQVNAYADSGLKIEYKEGSIPESGNWVGKKTWDDYPIICYISGHGGYMIFKDGYIRYTGYLTLEQYIRIKYRSMLSRCTKKCKQHSSYSRKGIYVDESFKDFNNFYNWFINQPNFKYLKEARLELDKDLKGKGYYGVDSCLLLPDILNKLLSNFHSKVGRKSDLPLCFRSVPGNNGNYAFLDTACDFKHSIIMGNIKDISYSDEFILNMMQEFMRDRGIKTWNYITPIIEVGRKWLTYKRLALELFQAEAKKCYDKGWITLEIYNLCLAYDIKITD